MIETNNNSAMKDCIIHIGMPKTGSTSIQLFMTNHLRDERFEYINFGKQESCFGLINIFSENQVGYIHNILQKVPAEALPSLKAAKTEELSAILMRLKKLPVTPVLSCELLTSLKPPELKKLKIFFESYGYNIRLIGYLRPVHLYAASAFQQLTKLGKRLPDIGSNPIQPYQRFLDFENIFGKENIQWFKFDPKNFPEGCVVRHFFQTIGAKGDFDQVENINEGISLNALKLQYAYRKYIFDVLPIHERPFDKIHLFLAKLSELKGPKLQFHASVFSHFAEDIASMNTWMEARTGASFGADVSFTAMPGVIKSAEDLEDFEPESLQWLAAQVGKPSVSPHKGEEAARKVAVQMHDLFLKIGTDGMPKKKLEQFRKAPFVGWLRPFTSVRLFNWFQQFLKDVFPRKG